MLMAVRLSTEQITETSWGWQESGVRSQESGVRSQESGVRSQEDLYIKGNLADLLPQVPCEGEQSVQLREASVYNMQVIVLR